jgi:hypothetical protein
MAAGSYAFPAGNPISIEALSRAQEVGQPDGSAKLGKDLADLA